MKSTVTTLAAAIIATVAASSVVAQTGPTRAEVKKEAAADNKSAPQIGTDLSAPQKAAAGVVRKDPIPTTTDRADVKADAAASNTVRKPGAGEVSSTGRPMSTTTTAPSTTTRAEVKSEARTENKNEKKIGTDLSQPEKKAEGVIKK